VQLVAGEEVARHRDAADGDAEPPAHLGEHDHERDRDPRAPLEDHVQEGVARVVVVVVGPAEAELPEQVPADAVEARLVHAGRQAVEAGQGGAHVERRVGVRRHEQARLVQAQLLLGAVHEGREALGRAHAVRR
jgi:hypothetical protein